MNLEDALKDRKAIGTHEPTLLYYDGELVPDADSKYVRLYADPRKRTTYLLFFKSDIANDVYELSKEECVESGHGGFRRWRIGVRLGADVQVVEIRVGQVGQLIGNLVGMRYPGECKSGVAGCNPACCTVSSSGSGNCYCDYCCVGRESGPAIQPSCSCHAEDRGNWYFDVIDPKSGKQFTKGPYGSSTECKIAELNAGSSGLWIKNSCYQK